MKKILLFFSFILLTQSVFAEPFEKPVTLYLFWGKGCPHCEKERKFLVQLQNKYNYLQVREFEIYENTQNRIFLEKMSQELNFKTSSLPVTIINKQYFIGFFDEYTTGKRIEKAILAEHRNGRLSSPATTSLDASLVPDTIKVPFWGQIKIKELSLPLLSIGLGAIDGFNPCAMWVLVMLLSFLIGIQDRKKLILLGSLFLITSAGVYFLFLVAWLNFMLFLGYIPLIKISIGILAALGGGYYIKEFFTNKEGVCKVTGSKRKKMISDKLASLIKGKKIFLAAIAIVLLAFFVNVIELVCSAGIPAVYTQVLALTPLSTAAYYFHIFLYIFFFLLDDLIVFFIAIFSLHLMNYTAKYSRYSHLIGGSLLLVIGILLIFKPEWLMFG